MASHICGRIDESVSIQPAKLDMKDRRIISFLLEDCRMPLTKIAKAVRLSRDAVDYRIKKLQRDGIILCFSPLYHLNNLGFNKYHTFFLLGGGNKGRQKELIDHLKSHPNTRDIIEYSARWDLEFVMIAKDVQEYDRIITEIMNNFSDIIQNKKKMLIIENYHSVHLPYHFYSRFREPLVMKKIEKQTEVDKTNLKILEILSTDARISTYKIGRKIGLSPDAVSYRIKNMKDAGIILLFTSILNLTKLGYHWNNFTIQVQTMDKQTERRFIEFISRHKHIIRAVKTLGTMDLMIYIVTDSMNSLHTSIKEMKEEFGDMIKTHRIYPGYKEHIYNPFPKIIMSSYSGDKTGD